MIIPSLYHNFMKKYYPAVIISFVLLASCDEKKADDNLLQEVVLVPPRTHVVAGTPSTQTMSEDLTMNAVTTYTHRENIRATATGYVQQSQVMQGSRVSEGQLIFNLKTKEAEALGEEILKDPQINITGIIPIIARNAGIITQVFFQEGDYILDGDVFAELTKPSALAVKLYVPYEYNQLVTLRKRVDIRLPDGEMLRGEVKQLLPSEDVVSQTTPYLVSITPFRFLPENLNVTVTVPTKLRSKALVIPLSALQSNEEQTDFWIMKVVNDTLAVRQSVTPGMRTDSLIELMHTTMTERDSIVIQGAYGLPDSAAITLVQQL
jgi:multidrug efflux pump subunit AcrA (membrane-fusion protein)